MNLKELNKEAKRLKDNFEKVSGEKLSWTIGKYQGIKQTVEAVDNTNLCIDTWSLRNNRIAEEFEKDWQELKKLFGIK